MSTEQGQLRLRPLSSADASDLLTAFTSAPDMARQGSVKNLDEAREYIANLLTPGHLPWAVEYAGRLVGLVCLNVDAANRSAWFWYWMTASERGRGWTQRAAATVANCALTAGGLERLELGVRVNNPASIAVARAAGFIKEGTERDKFLLDDARVDVDIYGRLRDDPVPTTPNLPMRPISG